MVVEPSGFRTDWAGRSANESKKQIADYAKTAGAWRKELRADSGKQPGDPVRAAQAIINAWSYRNRRAIFCWAMILRRGHVQARRVAQDFSAVEKIARELTFRRRIQKKNNLTKK